MKYNKVLIIPVFLIIITLFIKGWVSNQYASVDQNAKYIERVIQNEVLDQEFDMITVLDSLSLYGAYSLSINTHTTYPYFIFLEGDLTYWSDINYVPNYSDLSSNRKYSFLDNTKGEFIIRKWVVDYNSLTYEVFSLIPLYQKYSINNFYIQSGINPRIGSLGSIEIVGLNEKGYSITIHNEAICNILLKNNYKPAIVKPIKLLDSILLILLLVLFFTLYRVKHYSYKWLDMLLLISGWAFFKIVLPKLSGISTLAHVNLFDPQYYAVSWFETSFGDLLINTIFILLISFKIESWFRSKQFTKLLFSTNANNKIKHNIISVLMILATFWIINYPFFQLRSIYNNSQVSIDIAQSLQFGQIKVLTLVIIVLVSFSTFLLYHSVVRHIVRLISSVKVFIAMLFIALVIYLPLSYLANMPFANFAVVNILIISGFWYFKLTSALNTASYKRLLYIILFFGIVSALYGYMINQFEMERKVAESQKVLSKKIAQADPFAEFLVSTALEDLAQDPFIISRMSSPFLSKNAVVSKVKQVFINSYLNKYEQIISLYDAKGVPFKSDVDKLTFFDKLREIEPVQLKTDYASVFRINDESNDFSKHYVGYTTLKKQTVIMGYVLLEFKEKQFSDPGVYPELLVDNRFKSSINENTTFAYYINNKLTNSIGSNEYPSIIIKEKGNVWNENNRLYVSASDGERSIIATIDLNKSGTLLSNFSFIWVITLFPILILWLLILIYNSEGVKSLSYTDRIIWYLNLAFIIPLVLVTSVTFRLLSNSFEQESNNTKKTIVKRISDQLNVNLANYLKDDTTLDDLAERLNVLSDNTQFDVNLFNLKGELIVSSRPGVYNKNVLAPYINPYALRDIKNNINDHLVIEEKIGSLLFNSSYSAVKSGETGELLGVISVPFFSSQSSLNSNRREAFNTILNVFVIVLFVTMLITYFAGKWLTKPLKIIRDKLKMISFSEEAEPINIQWSDELGMLIKAYNQMLISLEESKGALKRSEKEKAWREAAQQVAHEIKNPLTPMKLTLQRINNKIQQQKATTEELVVPLQSVLDQVETLNSIASSFSEFAKMPTPLNERVEIHAIIRKSVELFSSESDLEIKLQLVNQEVYSMVDPKLFNQILNNLILNAKQSIKSNQEKVIVEVVTIIDTVVSIKLKDNGGGINMEIADKVFIPRFTTKEQGSGIGLAMTKYGVENMGGKIYFESIENKGTTFTIEFPIIH